MPVRLNTNPLCFQPIPDQVNINPLGGSLQSPYRSDAISNSFTPANSLSHQEMIQHYLVARRGREGLNANVCGEEGFYESPI